LPGLLAIWQSSIFLWGIDLATVNFAVQNLDGFLAIFMA
jgi:hypothetical protein